MKKTTQTLLLVFSTLLLLVSVTGSAQGQPESQPTPRRDRQPPTGSDQDRRRGNAVTFSGTWNTVTDKGKKIVVTLGLERTEPGVVTGHYSPINALSASYKPSDGPSYGFVKVSASMAGPVPQNMAQIKGTVKDNVLRFTWIEDGGHGAGRFTLSSDGESFEGTYSKTSNPDDTSGGTWNGTRVHSFAGAWRGKFGDGGFELVLQQSGSQVTGQVNINSVIYVIREGRVDANNTLRFLVVRPRTVSGVIVFDHVLGTGELVMDAGGKSFKGKILNVDTSGTLIAR